MATACIAQVSFRFERKGRPVVAAFDIPDASSDGGLILLKGIDTQLGLTKRVAACLDDGRQPAKVQHQTVELVRQRVFGLAGGYADCNDAGRLVTNLPDAPQTVYEQIYCKRSDVENRLKELHHGLEMDRTGCSRFVANQFRVLLTLAAYILFQELQRRARGTACADAQVTTLRERLLKLAVWVECSVRRIVLHWPATFPWLSTWRSLARAVGATT